MSIIPRVKRAVGIGAAAPRDPAEDRDRSHVCRSCGETYHTDPTADIPTCRRCGGVRVGAA